MSPADALRYVEVRPAPPLDRDIECFWCLTGPAPAGSGPQRILPDGCVEIVLNFGQPVRRVWPDGRTSRQPRRMLVGQMDRHVSIRPEGSLDMIGIRFRPAGAFPFLALPLHEITNRMVALNDVPLRWAGRLDDRLPEAVTTSDRVNVLEAALRDAMPAARVRDPLVERAVGGILATRGAIEMDSLAKGAGIGGRALARRFKDHVGLGPKRLARIVRFQDALGSGGASSRRWVEVALAGGYYDQSHFNREFRSFTGQSPTAFFSADHPLTDFFTRRSRRSVSYKISA